MINISNRIIEGVGTRIRQWRKTTPLKGYELAKVLKISQGSLSDIENNKSLPSADTIAKFHAQTSINVLWLLTGKGPMTKEGIPFGGDQEIFAAKEGCGSVLDPELARMIEKVIQVYQTEDNEKIAMMKGFIEGLDSESD